MKTFKKGLFLCYVKEKGVFMPHVIIIFLFFRILLAASIIDIKTMFVPLSVIFPLYGISALHMIYTGSYASSLLGLFIGVVPLLLLSLISKKHETEEITLKSTSSSKKYRPIIFVLALIFGLILFKEIKADFIQYLIIVGIIILFPKLVKLKKTSPFFYFVNTLGFLSFLIMIDIYNIELIHWILAVLFSEFLNIIITMFDDTEKLVQEEKEIMKNGGAVYGGIGGGDIYLFGAIGLLVGFKALMITLFFSGIFHILFALIYFLYTGNKQRALPFIPAITFGFIYTFSHIDFFSIKNLFFQVGSYASLY